MALRIKIFLSFYTELRVSLLRIVIYGIAVDYRLQHIIWYIYNCTVPDPNASSVM
jgi:hypothetical protein